MSRRAPPVVALDARAAAFIASLPTQWAGYKLGALLGAGSTGVVLEGKTPDGRAVAVKALWPKVAQRVSGRPLPRFDHPGLEQVYDQKTEDGFTCRVRELLKGRSMARLTQDQPPLDATTVVEYLEQLLDALAAAHAQGVAHLDLRASNVFLCDRDGATPQLKILDFGLAPESWLQADDLSSSLLTTCPDGLAPEQAQGLPVGPSADLYSLGCLAFEWLTGERPYRGASRLEVMLKHVTEPTPHVSAFVDVPDALDAFVHHLMSKQAGLRPKDGAAARVLLRSVSTAMETARAEAKVLALSAPGLASGGPAKRPEAITRAALDLDDDFYEPEPEPRPSEPDPATLPSSLPRGLAVVLMLCLAGLLTPMLWPRPEPLIADAPPPRTPVKLIDLPSAPDPDADLRIAIVPAVKKEAIVSQKEPVKKLAPVR
ncbi:MAG: serine/threonine-protein kinase [Myxococcaceae bacterium]